MVRKVTKYKSIIVLYGGKVALIINKISWVNFISWSAYTGRTILNQI